MQQRIDDIISAYDQQGIHRTGTDVDTASGEWLCQEIERMGLVPIRDAFDFDRLDVGEAYVKRLSDNTRIEGVPGFDGAFTDDEGVTGKGGVLGDDDAEVLFGLVTPNGASEASHHMLQARRSGKPKALVAITDTSAVLPGLALCNAPDYQNPWGPPALQVSSEHAPMLLSAAASGQPFQVLAQTTRTHTKAFNVQAHIVGQDRDLAPLVIMTPRSGWWSCASERGGGIAMWLLLMEAFAAQAPRRSVFFTANTGHELGHLGLDHVMAQHPDLGQNAHAWMHLGANIGGTGDSGFLIQNADAAMRHVVISSLAAVQLTPARENEAGQRPGGEAHNVYDAGSRYTSLIGSTRYFHHPDDHWPYAMDTEHIVRLTQAYIQVAEWLANS